MQPFRFGGLSSASPHPIPTCPCGLAEPGPPKPSCRELTRLAVEVLAPSNARLELDARLRDFFDSGTRLAWVVHPVEQFVEVCRSPIDRQILGAGALLDGGEVLPGFQYPVADLFHVPDWD